MIGANHLFTTGRRERAACERARSRPCCQRNSGHVPRQGRAEHGRSGCAAFVASHHAYSQVAGNDHRGTASSGNRVELLGEIPAVVRVLNARADLRVDVPDRIRHRETAGARRARVHVGEAHAHQIANGDSQRRQDDAAGRRVLLRQEDALNVRDGHNSTFSFWRRGRVTAHLSA